MCPNPSLPPSPYLPSKTTRSGRKLRSLNPTSFVVFFSAAWKFHIVLGARQQEIPEHNIIQNNDSASVIKNYKKLFYEENNQVPPGSQTMNECYYIHCCHDHPDSCKECNHTIEHKLLVWTRSTVYCLQRGFHLTSKHFEVVLQCDYCNRGRLDKVDQSHHRKKNTFQESWLWANQQLVKNTKQNKTKQNKKGTK